MKEQVNNAQTLFPRMISVKQQWRVPKEKCKAAKINCGEAKQCSRRIDKAVSVAYRAMRGQEKPMEK